MNMKNVLLSLALLLLSGCGTTAFHPYVGQQQNWPTSPGGFVNSYEGMPVYLTWPPRPYIVLGSMDAAVSTRLIDPSLMHVVVSQARQLGADAVIVLHRGGAYAGNNVAYINKATVLLIKWR